MKDAREFLFPSPKFSGPSGHEREVVLERTAHYDGLLEPKVEFTSKTVIKEVKARLKEMIVTSYTRAKYKKIVQIVSRLS